MTTTVRRFYPHTTEWDGTDPASGDVRKLVTSLPAADSTSGCRFGGSGTKEITVDPYTAGRTTTGVDSAFGWAIDLAGADGMDSTATAKRFVPAGAWFFQGVISSSVASTNAVRVRVTVYRVAAAPSTTRTELFNHIQPTGGLVTAAGLNWSITTASQDEIVLEAGESLQATFSLAGTGQIGNLEVKFHTGDHLTLNDTYLDTPSPGVRTQYQETISAVCKAAASITDGTKTLTGVARDSTGTPVSGATAKLFDQSTDTRISTYTTGADGAFTFTRADNDTATYYVLGYSDGTHHGTSDRDLTAT